MDLYTAPTSITVTGGTAVAMSAATPPTGCNFAVANYNSASYRTRERIFTSSTEPLPNQGMFGMAKRKVTLQVPRDLADRYNINSISIEVKVQPESDSNDINILADWAAQLLISPSQIRRFLLTGVIPTSL